MGTIFNLRHSHYDGWAAALIVPVPPIGLYEILPYKTNNVENIKRVLKKFCVDYQLISGGHRRGPHRTQCDSDPLPLSPAFQAITAGLWLGLGGSETRRK